MKHKNKFRPVTKEETTAGLFPDFAPKLDEIWLERRSFVFPLLLKNDEVCFFFAKKDSGEFYTFQATLEQAAILSLFFCAKRNIENGKDKELKIFPPKRDSEQFVEFVAFQQKYEFSKNPDVRACQTFGKLFQALKSVKCQIDKNEKKC